MLKKRVRYIVCFRPGIVCWFGHIRTDTTNAASISTAHHTTSIQNICVLHPILSTPAMMPAPPLISLASMALLGWGLAKIHIYHFRIDSIDPPSAKASIFIHQMDVKLRGAVLLFGRRRRGGGALLRRRSLSLHCRRSIRPRLRSSTCPLQLHHRSRSCRLRLPGADDGGLREGRGGEASPGSPPQ